MTESAIPYADQIEAVRREIRQRHRVYPRLVATGRMTAAQEKLELERMTAVLRTLELVAAINKDVLEAGAEEIALDFLSSNGSPEWVARQDSANLSLEALLIRPADTGRLF